MATINDLNTIAQGKIPWDVEMNANMTTQNTNNENLNNQIIENADVAKNSAYYAEKNRYLLGNVTKKLEYGESIKINWYGDSNSDLNTQAVQNACKSNLDKTFGTTNTVYDRATSGYTAEDGYNNFDTNNDADIAIFIYGTNDAKNFDYATNVEQYSFWMDELIKREIEWGRPIIVAGCLPIRNDTRFNTPTWQAPTDPFPLTFETDCIILNKISEDIANKYSAPFIDSQEIIGNFRDEAYEGSAGKSLGVETTPFGDNLHITQEFHEIWGYGISAIFMGYNLVKKNYLRAGDSFATRKGIDPFSMNQNPYDGGSNKIKYQATPYHWASGDLVEGNRAYQLEATESLTYSFYVEEDNLIVYPNLMLLPSSQCKVTLDNDSTLSTEPIDDELLGTSGVGYGGATNFTITANSTDTLFNITNDKDFDPSVWIADFEVKNQGLKLGRKGWHTIRIECLSGFSRVIGLRAMSKLPFNKNGDSVEYEDVSVTESMTSSKVIVQGKSGTVGTPIVQDKMEIIDGAYNDGSFCTMWSSAKGQLRFDFKDDGSAENLTGTWGTISDINVKEQISDINNALDKVLFLADKYKHYEFKDGVGVSGKRTGIVIDDELEDMFEGHISYRIPTESEGKYLGWEYEDGKVIKEGAMIRSVENSFGNYLFSAIKEVVDKLSSVSSKQTDLERRLEVLEEK